MIYPGIMFKRFRHWQEFHALDQRLRRPFLITASAAYTMLRIPMIITCVFRTQAENTAVGGHPHSGHMADPVRAIDVRTDDTEGYPGLDAERVKWIRDFWDRNFRRGPFWSCIDEGNHLHFQVPRRE